MPEKYVLITRPKSDSLYLQERLLSLGIKSLIAPVIEIVPLPKEIDISGYRALIITSKHAVSSIPDKLKRDNFPIFSIGTETSHVLRQAGFNVTLSAQGNSPSLASCIHEYLKQYPETSFLHLGGENMSPAFQDSIVNNPSFNVTHIPVYTARAIENFPINVKKAIEEQQIDMVLFFSSRSADIFQNLIKLMAQNNSFYKTYALCLAPSIQKSLDKDRWKDVHCAQQPYASEMIKMIQSLRHTAGDKII